MKLFDKLTHEQQTFVMNQVVTGFHALGFSEAITPETMSAEFERLRGLEFRTAETTDATDFTPPDPYARGLATERPTTAVVDREIRQLQREGVLPTPERDDTPPDPYAAGLAAMQEGR